MKEPLKYITFNTAIGWVGILSSEKGLLRTTLPQPSDGAARRMLGEPDSSAERTSHPLSGLIERFRVYFGGEKTCFPDVLDLADATPFQRLVWETTRLIPYGETRSYGWVAENLKKPGAARAVGQALSRNPLLVIVPCHRVLQSNGGLGGFSSGPEIKIKLLALETERTILST